MEKRGRINIKSFFLRIFACAGIRASGKQKAPSCDGSFLLFHIGFDNGHETQ